MDLLEDIYGLTTPDTARELFQHSTDTVGESSTQATQGFHASQVQIAEHFKTCASSAKSQANEFNPWLDDLVAFNVSDTLTQVFCTQEDISTCISDFTDNVRRTLNRRAIVLEIVTTGFHNGCVQPWFVFTFDVNVTRLVKDILAKANSAQSHFLGLANKEVTDSHDLVVLVLQVTKHSTADTNDGVISTKEDFGFLEVFYGSYHLTGDINNVAFDIRQSRDNLAGGFIAIVTCLHLGFGNAWLGFTLDIQVPRLLSNVVLVFGFIKS